jgi:cbb3-type cytochrome oxidase subunit 3
MFEDIASSAVQMLMLLFFITLVFIVFSGILWTRSVRNRK